MSTISVHLLKPAKNQIVSYAGTLLHADSERVVVLARWERAALDLGYVRFEQGDRFYEYFYLQQWFNVFTLCDASDVLKGWYCNITRPARFDGVTLLSEDLELDLFVPPDRAYLTWLDEDEFAARGFDLHEPETYAAAMHARELLERMARAAESPFDVYRCTGIPAAQTR